MCNTKNTETIRQQLWCDVYTSYLKEMSHLESVKGANRAVEEFDGTFNDKLRCKDDAPFDFRTKTSLINSERVKHGFNPIETLNTDQEPPIINTSFKERPTLRDTTTYIERGLTPREIIRTESTQVEPISPKSRIIKETGLFHDVRQFFGFKNNQDSFE